MCLLFLPGWHLKPTKILTFFFALFQDPFSWISFGVSGSLSLLKRWGNSQEKCAYASISDYQKTNKIGPVPTHQKGNVVKILKHMS